MAASDETEQGQGKLRKLVGFFLGIALFVLVLALPAPQGMSPEAKRVAATVILMVCWWIGEALPLGVTGLVPVAAYPLLKVMPMDKVAANYADQFVFLLLGGFFIALAMERWNLHTRIALSIISLVGTSARKLVLGFMIACGFVSMWISNSATAMMMMPIGLGLVSKIEQMQAGQEAKSRRNFGACLMLAIAYGSSIGGTGTLVGTFPNLVFAGIFQKHFPGGPRITFVEWLKFGLPFAAIFLLLAWAYLVFVVLPVKGQVVANADEVIKQEKAKLGKMSRPEMTVLCVFLITAFFWVFRADIPLGAFTIPGWASLLGVEKYVHDATVAMFMGILCFILPADRKMGMPLLEWEQGKRAPWGILLLFGGGFAIAAGFEESGLTLWVGEQLTAFRGVPLPLIVFIVTFVITFLTEVTSNTATATITLPILAAAAIALNVNPMILMLPATIAATCAFMFPISTPPNAIAFSSGRVSMMQMAKTGVGLNVMTALFLTFFAYVWMICVCGISPEMPASWAR